MKTAKGTSRANIMLTIDYPNLHPDHLQIFGQEYDGNEALVFDPAGSIAAFMQLRYMVLVGTRSSAG